MFKLSVCIDIILKEYSFLERIKKTAELGFDAFEFWGSEGKDLIKIGEKAAQNNLDIAATVGLSSILTEPAKAEEAVSSIKDSIKICQQLNTRNLIVTTGNEQDNLSRKEQHNNIVEVLKRVKKDAEEAEVILVLEPLNTAVNHAGYYLSSSYEGYEILNKVDSPYIKLLFDVYHQQITEGNIIQNIKENIDLIGHFHIADVPGRHQPGTGELNYLNIFKAIADTDYDGFVGCEFTPSGNPEEALKNTKLIYEKLL